MNKRAKTRECGNTPVKKGNGGIKAGSAIAFGVIFQPKFTYGAIVTDIRKKIPSL